MQPETIFLKPLIPNDFKITQKAITVPPDLVPTMWKCLKFPPAKYGISKPNFCRIEESLVRQ